MGRQKTTIFASLGRGCRCEDLELMLDTVCSTAPAIRIGGSDIPTEAVRDRFLQLDSEHIQYVIDALNQTTTKINNIRAYLLTALYNAPVTIGPYYSAAVRHDFDGNESHRGTQFQEK